jgi:hypothetical protein
MRSRGALRARHPAAIALAVAAMWVGACGWVNGFDDFERVPGKQPKEPAETSGAGGAGGAGGGGAVTTGAGGMGSTGAAMDRCDASGVCGDGTEPGTCITCALEGDCLDELEACQSVQDCYEYSMCINACVDQACYDICAMQFPLGADIYDDLVYCAVCEECYVSCDGAGSGC